MLMSPDAILMVLFAAVAVYIAYAKLNCAQGADDNFFAWMPDSYDDAPQEESNQLQPHA